MNWVSVFGCGFLGLFTVLLVVPLTLRLGGRLARDKDFHHTHERPVPRVGGLALAVAFIGIEIFISILFPQERLRIPQRSVVVCASLAMFGLGFWDDIKPLGARRKLLVQILIALVVCYWGIGIGTLKLPFSGRIIALGGWGTVATVAWLVGFTNLINLIDGVDGLASGICLMLMLLLVYVGYQNGTFILLTAGMAGALLAFLWFNFPPARIYLGDGGAYFLGFQIGLFAIVGSQKGSVFAALTAPLFVLALPIVDMCLALLRRGLRGLPLFRADRHHIHHHLLGMGMSRRKVVLSLYGLSLVFLAMGFAAFWSSGQLVPVLLGLTVVILLLCAGRLSFSREWFAVGRTLGNSLAMRQEIQYALSLTHCLSLDGARCRSRAELFEGLVFAARRLGFTSVKLTLPEGERAWEQPNGCRHRLASRQELSGGCSGMLELVAPACPRAQRCSAAEAARVDMKRICNAKANERLFELMSELLAEGWVRAASQSKGSINGKQFKGALCFANGKLQPDEGSPSGVPMGHHSGTG